MSNVDVKFSNESKKINGGSKAEEILKKIC